MNPQQEAVALWKYLESRGVTPSVRQVGRLLRSEMRLRFREEQLRSWLLEFRGTRPGRNADADGTQKTSVGDAVGSHSGRNVVATSREKKVSLVSDSSSSVLRTSAALPGFEPEPPQRKARRRGKAPPDTAWIEPFKAHVRPLLSKTIAELSPQTERFTLARWFVFQYANCNADEANNRRQALKVMAGLSRLALDRDFGPMTVVAYLRKIEAVWELGGKRPIYSAWLVNAVTEWRQEA